MLAWCTFARAKYHMIDNLRGLQTGVIGGVPAHNQRVKGRAVEECHIILKSNSKNKVIAHLEFVSKSYKRIKAAIFG